MIVLILNMFHRKRYFAPNSNFYAMIKDYMFGMTIIEVTVRSWKDIQSALRRIPPGQLKFLIVNAHGTRNNICFIRRKYSQICLDKNYVSQIFAGLAELMAPDSYIVLNSCLTGYTGPLGYPSRDNLAMEFVKLTANRFDVSVIAPNRIVYVSGIFPVGTGWAFLNLDEWQNEITTCFGANVKKKTLRTFGANMQLDTDAATYGSKEDIIRLIQTVRFKVRDGIIPGGVCAWNIVQMVRKVYFEPNVYSSRDALFAELLNFLPIVYMIDMKECEYIATGAAPLGASLLYKFLYKAAVTGTLAFMYEQLRIWGVARKRPLYVDYVITTFDSSPLAARLRAGRA